MRFVRRYINYFILFACLVGLGSLFFLSIAADKKVVFSDPNLEAAVRELIESPVKPLHASELSKITELDASGRGITSLSGIEYLINLTVLNLENNAVQDVSPLAHLKKLRTLNLINNGLTDIQKANFDKLSGGPIQQLNLDYNVTDTRSGQQLRLSDIQILAGFTRLNELTLSQNKVSDISPLSTLVNLKKLNLEKNQFRDISALAQLKSLKTLNIGGNDVTDLTPLSGHYQMVHLYLYGNKNVKSVLPLAGLSGLKTLYLDDIAVGDDLPVVANMTALRSLSIANGQLRDTGALRNLINLRELNLRENDIRSLVPLSNLTHLQYLNIQANRQIETIQPLENLKRLEELDMQDVPAGDGISALANLDRLRFLDARNCGITSTAVLGGLMAAGALQDNPAAQSAAEIDLRDNPLALSAQDSYGPVRAYWENISDRLPYYLPEYAPLAAPEFSAGGGYYAQPFALTLTSSLENARIYYTLDGSDPTSSSNVYNAPVTIQSRAGQPSIFSEISEVSPRWRPPEGEVFKATVVRARVIDAAGNKSPIITNTYLVDPQKRYSLPVISLVTDPRNLFDHAAGIYVMGEIYDLFYNPDPAYNPWEMAANYTQRGQAWERPIHFEYIDVDGERGISQEVRVRIQGASSRERPQKSLRIYAGCEFGCEETVAYPLFPGLTSTAAGTPVHNFKSFLLRNSGSDWGSTMFRDALTQSLVEHTRLDIQAYQPVIVFINGEYWGIHNLRERLDEYYFESHYGIAPQDLVILGAEHTLEVGEVGDEQHYIDMLRFIEANDMADPGNYAYVQTLMDIENFIDYQILEIYSDNLNWPHVNIKFWRMKTDSFEPAAPYGQDGRWRWMVYDTDFAFGLKEGMNASANDNLTNAIDPEWRDWAGFLLKHLLQNPDFEARFIRRFADHLNTSFTPQHVLARIDQMQAAIEPEIAEHFRRWPYHESPVETWKNSVDVMRYFAENRPQAVREQIHQYFGLPGSVEIHLAADSAMGHLTINAVDLVEDTPGVVDPDRWSGVYFHGTEVEISAVPLPGYRFVKWQGINEANSLSNPLRLTLTENTTLQAVFEKDD